jgi:hypothetical protein
MKRVYLFFLLFPGLISLLQAQQGTGYDDANPLEVRPIKYIRLDTNQIKSIFKIAYLNLNFKNVICYQDTIGKHTVRIAYQLKEKKQWISFPTPFMNPTTDFKLIKINEKGPPLLVVKSDIAFEPWPSGERRKDAFIVYTIDSTPTQVFKLIYRCSEFSVGDRTKNGEGRYNFTRERKILIDSTGLTIEKLELGNLNDNEQKIFKSWFYFTRIAQGKYILINGKFIKQRDE